MDKSPIQTSNIPIKLRSHIPSLDGLRGIAILLVIVHHFAAQKDVGTGFTKFFLHFCEIGWSGVDLFFVLSGFLITGILIEAKGKPTPIKTFYARRTLRIFPLYYLSLVAIIFVWPAFSASPENFTLIKHNQAWYWSYLTNVLIVTDLPLGSVDAAHFWSLAVEEQFYMVWPFIVLFVSIPTLRRICIFVIFSALIFRTSSYFWGWGHSPAYVLTISRLDALGIGALVSTILREPILRDRLIRHIPKIFVALTLLFIAVVALQGSFRRGPLMLSIGLTLLAGIFAIVVGTAANEQQPLLRRVLEGHFLRFFGKYSYAMYIFHPFIMEWMNQWFPSMIKSAGWFSTGIPKFFVFTIVGLGITSIAALLSWNLVERWFLTLKKCFEHRPQQVT